MINWNSHPGEVVAIISDIHANKRALAAVIESMKQKRTDRVIVLGDLLTYGIDVVETLDMTQGLLDKGAELVLGNHDEMYMDLMSGKTWQTNENKQESVSYTLNLINKEQFNNWPWKKSIVHNNVYFSHANPFEDWTYIKKDDDFHGAATKLHGMGHIAGVFGHTHRSSCFSLLNGFVPFIDGQGNDTFALNCGSVGQPRSDLKKATYLRLASHDDKLWAEIEQVPYDIQAHVNDLQNSPLSPAAKEKFSSFFLN